MENQIVAKLTVSFENAAYVINPWHQFSLVI
jgi:hypothetical protein